MTRGGEGRRGEKRGLNRHRKVSEKRGGDGRKWEGAERMSEDMLKEGIKRKGRITAKTTKKRKIEKENEVAGRLKT